MQIAGGYAFNHTRKVPIVFFVSCIPSEALEHTHTLRKRLSLIHLVLIMQTAKENEFGQENEFGHIKKVPTVFFFLSIPSGDLEHVRLYDSDLKKRLSLLHSVLRLYTGRENAFTYPRRALGPFGSSVCSSLPLGRCKGRTPIRKEDRKVYD